jgi:hypothetical protein
MLNFRCVFSWRYIKVKRARAQCTDFFAVNLRQPFVAELVSNLKCDFHTPLPQNAKDTKLLTHGFFTSEKNF